MVTLLMESTLRLYQINPFDLIERVLVAGAIIKLRRFRRLKRRDLAAHAQRSHHTKYRSSRLAHAAKIGVSALLELATGGSSVLLKLKEESHAQARSMAV